MDPSHFSRIVASAVSTLLADKVVRNLAGQRAVLAVDIALGVHVGTRHGLHANCCIQ
jgi:hypothetical protein